MIPVSAQWALEGKQPDGAGYRILACSTAELDRGNFADALSRFQLGELSTLPQVSVSYARLGTQPGLSYLALAIHWYATDGERHAQGVTPHDDQGRLTAYTSYFCLPYKRLADAAIGYQAMYSALHPVTLTTADGPPRQVQIAAPTSRTPVADDLAMRVAPLLLTGRPVCVLGAEGTEMEERLAFIDSVMGLLPYGFRARMTAATWTRATNRQHRFRLFFSSARRADESDHVVTWGGNPELVSVEDREAVEYGDWLQDTIGQLARLADLTAEMGFGPKDTLQAVESVLGIRHRLRPRSRPLVPGAGDGHALPPQVHADASEEALLGCAEHAKLANATRLRSDVAFLAEFAESEISEDRRARYRALIGQLGLLRRDFLIEGRYRERLYGALLRMAFGVPLDYPGYCQIEQSAGIAPGDPPHDELLAAIVKAGIADPIVNAIVHWHLWKADEKKLTRWLRSDQVDPLYLIRHLSYNWDWPQHARIACDVTLEFLERARNHYVPRDVRRELCELGFLARALHARHPDNNQHQVHVLYRFLKAAYPRTPAQDLSERAIVQILDLPGAPPPTPALLSAVLMLLHKPGAWQLAWDAYVRGSLDLADLDGETVARLRDRLPHIGVSAIDAAARGVL